MNRKQRRKMGKKKPREGGVVTLHFSPSDSTQVHMALLLAQLAHAFELGSKLPGVTWPIHVSVDFDGKKVCGTVKPGSEAIIIQPPAEA